MIEDHFDVVKIACYIHESFLTNGHIKGHNLRPFLEYTQWHKNNWTFLKLYIYWKTRNQWFKSSIENDIICRKTVSQLQRSLPFGSELAYSYFTNIPASAYHKYLNSQFE